MNQVLVFMKAEQLYLRRSSFRLFHKFLFTSERSCFNCSLFLIPDRSDRKGRVSIHRFFSDLTVRIGKVSDRNGHLPN